MNVITEAQANEILAREVAEQLDQGPIPQTKVIFEGKIMDRTAVAEIIDERITSGRKSAFFDIQDAIEDNMQCCVARQKLRNNILFGMRFRIVSQARAVFYGMSEASRELGHIDKFNEFLCDLDLAGSSANYSYELGYDEFGSGMNKLKALLSVYDKWHTAALADANNLNLIKFTVPSIASVITEERPADKDELEKELVMGRLEFDETYGKSTMDRIHSAVLLNKGMPVGVDPELFKDWTEIVANARDMIEATRANKAARAKVVAPYIERIIDEATRVPEDIEFYQLDMDTQKALIESTLRSLEKIPEQLKKDYRVNVSDMVMQCAQVRRLRMKLNDVLSDTRFA